MKQALLLSAFVIATCGLVYELIAGTAASYLLGDSVTQFSTVIGAYLFAMGIGSYLSKFVHKDLVGRFIQIEILVGLAGGLSSAALFLAFGRIDAFRVVLYGVVILIGTLVGMEIPLLLRILKDQIQFKDLVSQVLSLDYLGALAASLVFPLWLVPQVGLIRGALVFGMANIGIALWTTWVFRDLPVVRHRIEAVSAFLVLVVAFGLADPIADLSDEVAYKDEVILTKSTHYQRIVMTKWRNEFRLYLNGHLQFSSQDEYRYHEALVHPGLAATSRPDRVLVLGGGDGLAVREILRDPRVREIVLVDLDPGMTDLFRDHTLLSTLNSGSLKNSKVTVVNEDAFIWLERESGLFDFVVMDFPDPSNYSLGKLYTTAFYQRLLRRVAPEGRVVVQSTSPLFARKSYWCINETIKSVGLQVMPYHAYVPSFGEWGFILASRAPIALSSSYPEGLRFVSPAVVPGLFEFPADMSRVPVEINRLNSQVLVHYYESEWREFGE